MARTEAAAPTEGGRSDPTPDPAPSGDEERLLGELHRAIGGAPRRPSRIDVGVALSIALGRRRGTVSCGGCEVPLEFEGIPARTDAGLRLPFRLVFEPAAAT